MDGSGRDYNGINGDRKNKKHFLKKHEKEMGRVWCGKNIRCMVGRAEDETRGKIGLRICGT